MKGKTMKATIELEILPIAVPAYVLVGQAPSQTRKTLEYSDLDPHTLATLCEQFRKDVFKKAGKPDPALPQKRRGSFIGDYTPPPQELRPTTPEPTWTPSLIVTCEADSC